MHLFHLYMHIIKTMILRKIAWSVVTKSPPKSSKIEDNNVKTSLWSDWTTKKHPSSSSATVRNSRPDYGAFLVPPVPWQMD